VSEDPSPFQPPPFGEPTFAADEEIEDDVGADGDEELDDDELDDDDELEDDEDDELEDDEEDEDEEPAGQAGNVAPSGNGVAGVAGGAARAVLEHVARSIVDDPDAVLVDIGEGRSGVRLSLHVAPSDMGRIIGKRGRVAQALRAVVRAAAAGEGLDATVDIVD
jgi:predicted RNA-binding protein YlqC (UPF0109 family)